MWGRNARGNDRKRRFSHPLSLPLPPKPMRDTMRTFPGKPLSNRALSVKPTTSNWSNTPRALFQRGTEIARKRDLILVDTKYEFGKNIHGDIVLIDEIHTPDSSRYFYADGYAERQAHAVPQKQLSKEFVRQWLISNGFQGLDGQEVPFMSDKYINSVSDRYVELYENITGVSFVKADSSNMIQRIENNVLDFLNGV